VRTEGEHASYQVRSIVSGRRLRIPVDFCPALVYSPQASQEFYFDNTHLS